MYTCATPSNGLVAVIGLFEGWLQFLLPLIEVLLHTIFCLNDYIINTDPLIGGEIDKNSLYRQCTTRIFKETKIKEFKI